MMLDYGIFTPKAIMLWMTITDVSFAHCFKIKIVDETFKRLVSLFNIVELTWPHMIKILEFKYAHCPKSLVPECLTIGVRFISQQLFVTGSGVYCVDDLARNPDTDVRRERNGTRYRPNWSKMTRPRRVSITTMPTDDEALQCFVHCNPMLWTDRCYVADK